MNITVGELRDRLKEYSDDTEVTFGCNVHGAPLVFYAVKPQSENVVQIELNEEFEPGRTYSVEVPEDF